MGIKYVKMACSNCHKQYKGHPNRKRGALCKSCINSIAISYTKSGWGFKDNKFFHPCVECFRDTISTKWQVTTSGGRCRECDRRFWKRVKESGGILKV